MLYFTFGGYLRSCEPQKLDGFLVIRVYKFSKELKLFFWNLFSQAYFRQTKYKVMITKEGSTKIVNFMTLGAGVLVQGRGHISHIVKMHFQFLRFYCWDCRSINIHSCWYESPDCSVLERAILLWNKLQWTSRSGIQPWFLFYVYLLLTFSE